MDLKQLIADYQPSEKTKKIVRDTNIVLLVGITGAGKDAVKNQLLQKPGYRAIISHTTRSPRINNGVLEIPNKDYYFVNQATIRAMLKAKQFVEAKFFTNNIYGTSIAELKAALDKNKIALTDLEVQGVDEYKKISKNVIAIFILPPGYKIWQERLRERYKTTAEFEAEWPKRRLAAIKELTLALKKQYYYFVINDDLTAVVEEIDQIVHQSKEVSGCNSKTRQLAETLLKEIKTA